MSNFYSTSGIQLLQFWTRFGFVCCICRQQSLIRKEVCCGARGPTFNFHFELLPGYCWGALEQGTAPPPWLFHSEFLLACLSMNNLVLYVVWSTKHTVQCKLKIMKFIRKISCCQASTWICIWWMSEENGNILKSWYLLIGHLRKWWLPLAWKHRLNHVLCDFLCSTEESAETERKQTLTNNVKRLKLTLTS